MIAVLVLIYASVVAVLFKFKILKPQPYPIAGVLVAGVLLIGGVVVAWTQCAPVSPRVVTTQYVTQLVPYVKGQIVKVNAQANTPMKKGDLLLEINPAPYQFAVEQAEAQLQGATDGVAQAEAGLSSAKAGIVTAKAQIDQAQAAVSQSKSAVANAQAGYAKAEAALADAQAGYVRSKAADDLARTEEQIALNLQKADAGAISTLKVTQAVQNREAADAALQQAQTGISQAQAALAQAEANVAQYKAAEQQADAGLAAAQSAEQQTEAAEKSAEAGLRVAKSKVPAASAQLDDARFNLDECRMLAPSDGYVVNWAVQEGTMLVPMPMSAAGTFIDTSETFIVASYPQNWLDKVRPGNTVELIINTYPGRLFTGVVNTVIPATGEGQYAPGGTIPMASKVGSQGYLAVKINLTGDSLPEIPLGAGGAVAVYTDYGKPLHIISKITIRMKKWLLYVIPS